MKFQIDERYKPLIDQWIEALRSGEYKQGQGTLYCHNRFCCLGVLCNLQVNVPEVVDDSSSDFAYPIHLDDHGAKIDIPVELMSADAHLAAILTTLNDLHIASSESAKNMAKRYAYEISYPVKSSYNFEDIANILEQVIEYVPKESA